MQEFVKIIFRDSRRKPVYLSLEKWEGILTDPKTLVPYKLDTEEKWTGRTINKAEVIDSDPDEEYSKLYDKRKLRPYKHLPTGKVVMVDPTAFADNLNDYQRL